MQTARLPPPLGDEGHPPAQTDSESCDANQRAVRATELTACARRRPFAGSARVVAAGVSFCAHVVSAAEGGAARGRLTHKKQREDSQKSEVHDRP